DAYPFTPRRSSDLPQGKEMHVCIDSWRGGRHGRQLIRTTRRYTLPFLAPSDQSDNSYQAVAMPMMGACRPLTARSPRVAGPRAGVDRFLQAFHEHAGQRRFRVRLRVQDMALEERGRFEGQALDGGQLQAGNDQRVDHADAQAHADHRADGDRVGSFQSQAAAVRHEGGVDDGARAVAMVERNELFTIEVTAGDAALARQPVAGGYDAHALLAMPQAGLHARHVGKRRRQAYIAEARGRPFGDGGRIAGMHGDGNLRMPLAEQPDAQRDDAHRQRGHHADAQRARALLADGAHRVAQAVEADERALHLAQQELRLGGRFDAAGLPREQAQAGGGLELRDHAADIGLRRMQLGRGHGHGARQHDGAKGLDLLEVHGGGDVCRPARRRVGKLISKPYEFYKTNDLTVYEGISILPAV